MAKHNSNSGPGNDGPHRQGEKGGKGGTIRNRGDRWTRTKKGITPASANRTAKGHERADFIPVGTTAPAPRAREIADRPMFGESFLS